MAEQPLPYRKLRKILKSYGIEEDKKRGKGSERMFVGMVDNKIVKYPTKCHNEGDTKPIGVIKAIRRTFKLTNDNGVSDKDFYGRS